MQYSITLVHGEIALKQPGGVLGHCPVEKQMIVPLSANQMGWHINLNKSLTVSPAKHPHTITPHSSCFTVGTTHGDHPFTCSVSHKDTAVGTKNLTFGLIRPKDTFPHFHQNVTIYQSKTVTLFLFCRHRYRLYTVATAVSSPFKKYSSTSSIQIQKDFPSFKHPKEHCASD